MSRGPGFITRIVDWLRAGYPDGVPQNDYQPLFALLERQLTADEVKEVTRDLIDDAVMTPAGVAPITRIDAAVAISQRTHALPSESDIARVRERLERKGWPFDDAPLRATPGDDGDGAADQSDSGQGGNGQGGNGRGEKGQGENGQGENRQGGGEDPHGSGPYGGA